MADCYLACQARPNLFKHRSSRLPVAVLNVFLHHDDHGNDELVGVGERHTIDLPVHVVDRHLAQNPNDDDV